MHFIFAFFIIISFVFGLYSLIVHNDYEVFNNMAKATFDDAKTAIQLVISLIGVMTFWLGIMRIGEKAGVINRIARVISPFFSKIFKGVPKDHPANASIVMNFSANFLGMDNAATPMGLKAMDQLQELNPEKDRASDAQIMFLVMNTSGLTLIPTTIMADLTAAGAPNPTIVFLPILLATFVSSLVGLIGVSIAQKINLLHVSIAPYIIGAIALFVALVFGMNELDSDQIRDISNVASGVIIMSIVTGFIAAGMYKKINVFDAFIDGAKEGFSMGIKILPYLAGIIVCIGVFKASGAMDFIVDGIRTFVSIFTGETRFVDALPTGLMKPISGSGARGMMVETWNCTDGLNNCSGVNSFAGKTSAVMRGATETTFYVLAVYFGSVGIKNTRNAVWLGLLADLAGIIAAIYFSYQYFL